MSAIFGILNINEKPVQQEDLLNMQMAMQNWGSDGKYLWNEGSAGMGQMQLYNTPESEHEHFPLSDPSGNLIFVAACRIDNREELFQKLNISFEKRQTLQNGRYLEASKDKITTDAELIFEAYQKYGKDCVHHLLGDWSFAVWDRKEKEFFIARDQLGMTSLYYSFHKGVFAFSSSIKGIKAISSYSIELDNEVISGIIEGIRPEMSTTVYSNIKRLSPATFLTYGKNGIRIKRYFSLDQKDKKYYKSREEYYEVYQDVLENAVNVRLRSMGSIGTTLSSGIDSSVITGLAAKMLDQQTLYSFTAAPKYLCKAPFENRLSDESALAIETAAKYKNIDHTIFRSENISPLEGIKRMQIINDEPVCSYNNAFWLNELMNQAKQKDCKVLLIGQGGNYTISWKRTDEGLFRFYLRTLYLRTFHKNAKVFRTKNSIFKSVFTQSDFTATINNSFWARLGYYNAIEVRDPSTDLQLTEFCLKARYSGFISNRSCTLESAQNLIPKNVIENQHRGFQSSDLRLRLKDEIFEYDRLINETEFSQFQIIDKEKLRSGFLNLQSRKEIAFMESVDFLKNISFLLFLTQIKN